MHEFKIITIDGSSRLEPMQVYHAGQLLALTNSNRYHLKTWLTWVDRMTTQNDFEKFIQESISRWKQGSDYGFVLFAGQQLAGRAGLYGVDQINKTGSIGYWLGTEFEGKGMMTSACKKIIEFGFSNLGLNRIEIRCATGNTRSAAIPERLGFVHEGIVRQGECVNGEFVDLHLYSLLKQEWELTK
jgi:ribosomal-protein-serine acetyltransferase